MLHQAPEVPRLDLPARNYWNECLHGVARAGIATVFPRRSGSRPCSARAACHASRARFPARRAREAPRVSTPGRPRRFTRVSPPSGRPAQPLFRDPRWGRGHETATARILSLTGRLGVAFCQGLQGDDPRLQARRHAEAPLAVHSGPRKRCGSASTRPSRTKISTRPTCPRSSSAWTEGAPRRDGGVQSRERRALRGSRACSVASCAASGASPDTSSATCLRSGLPREPSRHGELGGVGGARGRGGVRSQLRSRVQSLAGGRAARFARRVAARRRAAPHLSSALQARHVRSTGAVLPFAAIPFEVNDCPEHAELALAAARDSLVLLKNEGGLLRCRRALEHRRHRAERTT